MKARYYKCDRCGALYEDVGDDAYTTKRNGPHAVRFEYTDKYGNKVSKYDGEWCNSCTFTYLAPLVSPLPQPAPKEA